MEPSEIALHLPEWVIPEGTDLNRLRDATEQLIAEFSRPIQQDYCSTSMLSVWLSSSWTYTSKGTLDPSKWLQVQHTVPQVHICLAAERLRDRLDFEKVLHATIPSGTWAVEYDLCGMYSWAEISRFSLRTRRVIRLEWLKLLKDKLDGT